MNAPHPFVPVDPLGEALHFLRMSGSFYCRSEVSAPWGIAIPPMKDCLMLHVVTAGHCWLEVDGTERRLLQVGDLALVPHGAGHALRSEPGVAAMPLFDLPRAEVGDRYELLRLGGGGSASTFICGVVRFDHPAAQHLVKVLPRVIGLEAAAANAPAADWVQSTLRFLMEEARAIRPGGETVITRLADILVIQAIRGWIAQAPQAQTGWLGALQDRQIGRAIALIHREPARAWSVAALAGEVAMSRSAFAARFTALVGEPVMQYLARWRMNVALTRLQDGDARLADLAGSLGYQSEAAFSRAFKRFVGMAPGAARRSSRTPEAAARAVWV